MSLLFRTDPGPVERRGFPVQGDDVPAPGHASALNYVYRTDDALKVAAVVACVGLRAGAFAQLPLKSYRDRNGMAEPVEPQPELIRNPSDAVVPSVWKTQMSISRDVWGYAAGLILAVDAAGYPSRVDWLEPDAEIRSRVSNRQIQWWIGGQPVDGSRIIHVPSRWVLPGDPRGISPLEYSGLVELARRAQDFGRDWFRNGAVPSSIVYSDTQLTGEQADDLAATIWRKWRSRKPAVLGSGMRYETISVPANESQFLETCRQAAADVAISFNMPPEKIGAAISGQSVTYANREQNQQQYLVDSINPDLVVICESLDRHSPRGQYCRFNTGAFLRSDLMTRYKSYEIGVRAKFLTPNEARALEEMGPIAGGDDFPEVPRPTSAPNADDA